MELHYSKSCQVLGKGDAMSDRTANIPDVRKRTRQRKNEAVFDIVYMSIKNEQPEHS